MRWQQILATRSALRLESLREQLPSLDAATLSSTFPLFSPDTLDLAVCWSSTDLGISGFHYLADLPVATRSDVIRPLVERAGESLSKGRYEESAQARTVLLDSLASSELSGGGCPIVVSQDVSRAQGSKS